MKAKIFNPTTFRDIFPIAGALEIHLEDANGVSVDITRNCSAFTLTGDAREKGPIRLTLELYPNQVEISADVVLKLREMQAAQHGGGEVVEGEVVNAD